MEQLNRNNLEKLEGAKNPHGIRSPLKRLYTLREAAEYLGRSLWSMRELVWSGKIPFVRDQKKIWIDLKDLDRFIEVHKTIN